MNAVAGPRRQQKINDYLELNEDIPTGNVFLTHKLTKSTLKIWVAVVGLEEGAWIAMETYAERVKDFQAVNWDADEIDFLFPCANFITRYLDPVGMGEKTMTEASAHLMEKLCGRLFKMPIEKSKGLYNKYIVSKVEGVVDPAAQYFILRLDDGSSDPKHLAACRKAVLVYAQEIKDHLPALAQDLLNEYGASYGTHCPKCWMQDINQIGFAPDGMRMNYQYSCATCSYEWEGY